MPYTPVRDIELIDTGSLGKEVLSNDAFTNLAHGISGAVTIALSNVDRPLTATEGLAFVLILTGSVTADVNVIVPQESRVYVVDNRCTVVGTHSITVRPPVGGGITVETGYQRALLYCDGSNVFPVASGVAAGGGSGAPTDAAYLTGAAHSLLTGERVVTDTSTIAWDLGTAGQARAIIPPDAVSYTHIQNVASSRILGRFTAGAGDVQEITPGTGLALDTGTGVLSATAVGQPLDATLTALAGLATGANQLPYSTGTDTFAQTPLTAFARTVLDDADAATVRGTISAQASDATLTALAGVTTGADVLPFFTGVDMASTTTLTAFMRGLLDDPDLATAQATLGITGGGGYTDEQAQDAVGAMLAATATIALAYADATPALTAAVVAGSIGTTQLTNDGVTYAKLQNVTDARLLGRSAGSAGDVQELTIGSGLTLAAGELTASGAGSAATLGAVVQRVATQGIVQNVNTTILFDTQTRDDNNFWAPGDPGKLSVPTTGWYSITAFVQWDSTTGVTRIVNVRVNGTQYIAVTSEGNAGVDQRQTVAVNWYLTAGDYVEIVLFQSTAGTRQITANASMLAVTTAPDPATTFLALTDTPDTYTGQAGKVMRVNAGATATEYGPVLGTMAQQDASAVAITGGTAQLTGTLDGAYTLTAAEAIRTRGMVVLDSPGDARTALYTTINAAGGTGRYALYCAGDAPNRMQGLLQLSSAVNINYRLIIEYPKDSINGIYLRQATNDTGAAQAVGFFNVAGSPIGAIATTATATAYNTTSDARLKHAIAPLTGAIDVVRRLRPITHRWRSDDSRGVGFLANEVADVVDGVVTGEPNAVDAEGNIQSQMIDMSKLIPYLTAGLKDALAVIDTLTARVASLETQLGV